VRGSAARLSEFGRQSAGRHTKEDTMTATAHTPTARRFGSIALRTALLAGIATAGALAVAGAAQAATPAGPYKVTASPYLNEHSAPTTSAAVVGKAAHGSSVYISCQTTGSVYNGTDIWDRLPNGGYVTDDLVTTPVFDGYSPGIARCAGTPAVKVGRTDNHNEGTAGQCTWWAINEFHAFSGHYPDLLDPADNGDARYWATNAAYDGWTVTAAPRVNSIVVFPPGVNGASTVDGHVAWVTRVGNGTITFTEMNGPAGPFHVDTRTVSPSSSVRYILAP
jgi:surface antigen